MHKFLYLVCLIIFQSGCASVISDESQPITFLSVCGTKTVSDAECFLKNSDGDYYVKTPGTIMINKSFGDLSITCTKNNVSISESQSSKTGLTTAGNIIWGGLIGAAVDIGTGSGYKYQNTVIIDFKKNCENLVN